MAESGTPPYIGLNGELVAGAAARISPLSDGFQYGHGVFETIRILRGLPAFFPDHVDRLRRSAAELGLSVAASPEDLRSRCARVIAANGASDGSLKIVVFQDSGATGELIVTRDRVYSPERYARGFALKTVEDGWRAGALHSVKTLNYLKNITARRAAEAEGFDDVLFVGADGTVLECAGSNVFVVAGGRVLTPPLTGAILPGIARGRVIALLPAAQVREQAIAAALLYAADEIFVTNSLMGVMPVSRIDQQVYDLNRNPVTRAAAAAFQTAESESLTRG